MAKNYYQDSDIIDYTADADVVSGELVIKGSLIGVAIKDIADTETGAIKRTGVWTLTKAATVVFAQGDPAYYNTTTKEITDVTAGNTLVGTIAYPAIAEDEDVKVALD